MAEWPNGRILAAIRRLPLDKRFELTERAGHEAAEDCQPQPLGVSLTTVQQRTCSRIML